MLSPRTVTISVRSVHTNVVWHGAPQGQDLRSVVPFPFSSLTEPCRLTQRWTVPDGELQVAEGPEAAEGGQQASVSDHGRDCSKLQGGECGRVPPGSVLRGGSLHTRAELLPAQRLLCGREVGQGGGEA